jgi:hypothetical protein
MTSDHVQQRIVLLLSDVHDAARSGDWAAVKEKTEQVLHLNPFNHDARAYWSLARNGGVSPEEPLEVRIAGQLDTARIAVAAQGWDAALDAGQNVLGLDPANAEAKGHIRAAQEALATPAKRSRGRQPQPAPAPRRVREDAEPAVADYVFVDSNFLTKALAGLVAVVSILYLAAAGLYFYGAGVVEKVDRGEATASDASRFDDTATLMARLLVLGFVSGVVLLLIWVYRESTNARAMGFKTMASPAISVLLCVVLGTLGSYLVLRDLLHRLRGSLSVASEALLVAWFLSAAAGLSLGFQSIRHPADNSEWAHFLMLACYGSVLLALAGLLLAYSIRRGHRDLMDRYLRPNRAPRAETADSVAA